MPVNLKQLIGKLNDKTKAALEASAGLCLSRTHYNIELEHLLLKLLDQTDNDVQRIIRHFGVDQSRLTMELMKSLDKLKTGNGKTPAISPDIVKMLNEAWLLASVNYGLAQIRTGHCILALVTNEELSRELRDVSGEFKKITADLLTTDLEAITAKSGESALTATTGSASGGGDGAPKTGGKTPNLDAYTVNLTERAKSGKIDNVLGRDAEVRQIVDILMRRRQNNPILTGEAGVGKTAVVEGFALRIAHGDVPPPLQNVTVRTLDLALLQAGASLKGEFENRLKGLIEEVKSSPTPIILFIDEAHTMIGAGGQEGQGDAANLLKPALARGELRTIAATTWAEYKKYFEKDPALARRFQVVKVEEPTEEVCNTMLRGIVGSLEKHHNVRILDEGVRSAVKLSHRYIAGRQLPDKAVSVLDTACARLALGQSTIPGMIEDAQRTLDDIEVQERVLTREQATGVDHSERLQQLAKKRTATEAELATLKASFEKQKELVEKSRAVRAHIEEKHAEPGADLSAMRAELAALDAELKAVQGETPLIRVCVDAQIVGEVISNWTGIPLGKMAKDEIESANQLDKLMGERVIGQDHALVEIAKRIRTSKAGINDPEKPIGVFMLVGPSGVGKTETALSLADIFYGGDAALITINMSEFQEAHTVSTLKGAPPGYVGYGEGGVLTEAVRRRPYAVVLLDECEKAHPDVLELFFQVFDKGRMEDGQGREIDFKNTIIILTSNAATDTLMKLVADPETMPSPEGIIKAMKPELDKVFKPAFLGRMVIIPYYPVRDENLKKIVRLKLNKIKKRMFENQRIAMTYDEKVVDAVAARCTEVESGARNVDNILTNTLLPDMARQLLTTMAAGEKVTAISVTISDDGSFAYN